MMDRRTVVSRGTAGVEGSGRRWSLRREWSRAFSIMLLGLLLTAAATVFPTSNGMRATIVKARQSWQSGLATYGLWGNQVQALKGDHSVDNPIYGASSDGTVALVVGLEGPSLDAMDAGLAYGSDLERILIIALSAMFVMGLAGTVYLRRRMAKTLSLIHISEPTRPS